VCQGPPRNEGPCWQPTATQQMLLHKVHTPHSAVDVPGGKREHDMHKAGQAAWLKNGAAKTSLSVLAWQHNTKRNIQLV